MPLANVPVARGPDLFTNDVLGEVFSQAEEITMKKKVLLLGLVIGGGVVAASLASPTVRQSVSKIPGRMKGWMMDHMPEE